MDQRTSHLLPPALSTSSRAYEQALTSFRRNEFVRACELAEAASRQALNRSGTSDARLAGQALHLQGQSEMMVSRIRRAYEAQVRAAQLAAQVRDAALEAQALAQVSYTAGILGRVDESLEAAQFALRLAERGTDATLKAVAHNVLGIAMFWNGSYDESDQELADALCLAREQHVAPVTLARLAINRCACEIYRQSHLRQVMEQPINPQRLGQLLEGLPQQLPSLMHMREPGVPRVMQLLLVWMRGMAAVWTGDLAQAQALEHAGSQVLSELPLAPWLDTLLIWLRLERERVAGQWQEAADTGKLLIQRATALEHEQMAFIGHHLRMEVLRHMGHLQDALQESQALLQREARIRGESLKHRRQVAHWRFELRQRSQELEALQLRASQLHRQALEDPLTQLPNRRALEERLDQLLQVGAGLPEFSLLMLDLDRFKDINDMFSHQIGDEVLCELGQLLREAARPADLPARLSGDEFLLVLLGQDEATARETGERLRRAVAAHDWDRLAPGLRVSISLGATQALPHDSRESLMSRADNRMYGDKRLRVAWD